MVKSTDTFMFHSKTENCKLGYYGIQCELQDSKNAVWKCIFPTKMSKKEIARAIMELFNVQSRKIKVISFVFRGNNIKVNSNQSEDDIIEILD